MTTEETWFYLGADDEQCGPVTRAQLVALVQQGHVPDAALVWRPGFEGWRPIRAVEELKADSKPPEKAPVPKSPEPKAAPPTAALQQLLGQPRQAAPKAPPPKAAASRTAPAAKKPAVRKDRTPVAIGAVFAVAAVAAVAAMYRFSDPARTAPPVAAPPVLAQAEMELPDPAPAEPPVVRVKNPFDESEVFEFPPGTPANVARDRVADILMKRAMERQKHFEARTRTTKRRS
jgi:hypothetical protein